MWYRMFWISFTNGLGFKLTSQVQDFSHAEQYGSILWNNYAPNKIFRSTSDNLGVPWTIGRVIAECRTLNRANNGTNQFYVTSNNLKSKRIKTKSISIIKTISEKDSYWIISYFLNNKSIDSVFIFQILFSSLGFVWIFVERSSGSPTTTFMDPTKSFNPAVCHSSISDSLATRLIKNLLFDHNSLITTGYNPYGKGPFRFQKSAQWVLSMICDS